MSIRMCNIIETACGDPGLRGCDKVIFGGGSARIQTPLVNHKYEVSKTKLDQEGV